MRRGGGSARYDGTVERMPPVAAFLLPLLVALLPPAAAGPATAWSWPLPSPHHVVRGFDPPIQRWLAGHRGVDLAGTVGEPVIAAGDGVIAFAGRVARVPVVSVLHPNGLRTTYEPVATRRHIGDVVVQGEQIGHLVLAGSHCAPAACLHWGLKRGPDYLDPLALLRLNPVRLLPFDEPTSSAARAPAIGSAAGGVALCAGGLIRSRRVSHRRKRHQRRGPG
jgi:murein DD-endopeptidase MepM/ murein hydrolase activator NlpD